MCSVGVSFVADVLSAKRSASVRPSVSSSVATVSVIPDSGTGDRETRKDCVRLGLATVLCSSSSSSCARAGGNVSVASRTAVTASVSFRALCFVHASVPGKITIRVFL